MKTIFKINFPVQLAIVLSSIVLFFLKIGNDFSGFLLFYFGLGTWQAITSIIIWALPENRSRKRWWYLLCLSIIAFFAVLFFLPIFRLLDSFNILEAGSLFFMFSMIPIGFGMAVFNAYISYHEMKQSINTSENQFLNL